MLKVVSCSHSIGRYCQSCVCVCVHTITFIAIIESIDHATIPSTVAHVCLRLRMKTSFRPFECINLMEFSLKANARVCAIVTKNDYVHCHLKSHARRLKVRCSDVHTPFRISAYQPAQRIYDLFYRDCHSE